MGSIGAINAIDWNDKPFWPIINAAFGVLREGAGTAGA
jgi:hypothetical protein